MPARKLRTRTLAADDLAAASGGRGIRYGYYVCSYCSESSFEPFTYCPSCGRSGGSGDIL